MASQVLTPAATVEATISVPTLLSFDAALSAAMTLNVTIPSGTPDGTILHITAASDGTARTIAFGTGFNAPNLAGTISKTKVQTFILSGGVFVPMGAAFQID